MDLLPLSRSPPQPKIIKIFFLNWSFKFFKTLSRASGVCAKSTNILELFFNFFIHSNLPFADLIYFVFFKDFLILRPHFSAKRMAKSKFFI